MTFNSPCETIIWKILPAIRARFAEELQKDGLSQKEIAGILGITEASVSQYVNKKRGTEYKIDKALDAEIKKSVKHLKKSRTKETVLAETCTICNSVRSPEHSCIREDYQALIQQTLMPRKN